MSSQSSCSQSCRTERLAILTRFFGKSSKKRRRVVKGELLLALSTDNQTEAEGCFQQTMAICSSRAGARKPASGWCRLWLFAEGFDTINLQEARALLEELSNS